MLNPMLILSSCIVRCSRRHGGKGAAQMSIRRSRMRSSTRGTARLPPHLPGAELSKTLFMPMRHAASSQTKRAAANSKQPYRRPRGRQVARLCPCPSLIFCPEQGHVQRLCHLEAYLFTGRSHRRSASSHFGAPFLDAGCGACSKSPARVQMMMHALMVQQPDSTGLGGGCLVY